MTDVIEFEKRTALSAAARIGRELQLPRATGRPPEAGSKATADSVPTEHSLRHAAGDLACKHGISIDRAGMLVARFGRDRHTLERAAQALRDVRQDGC